MEGLLCSVPANHQVLYVTVYNQEQSKDQRGGAKKSKTQPYN